MIVRDVEIFISQLAIEFYDILRSMSKPDFIKRGHSERDTYLPFPLMRPRNGPLEEKNLAMVVVQSYRFMSRLRESVQRLFSLS
jgi:hypothetical protein